MELMMTRPRERALLTFICALLSAALLVLLIRSVDSGIRALAREEGSLRAPAGDVTFAQGFGEPGAPAPLAGDFSGEITTGDGEPGSGPSSPSTPPSPAPGPGPSEPPPPGDGLLGLLPDLPILPPLPPPPGRANTFRWR